MSQIAVLPSPHQCPTPAALSPSWTPRSYVLQSLSSFQRAYKSPVLQKTPQNPGKPYSWSQKTVLPSPHKCPTPATVSPSLTPRAFVLGSLSSFEGAYKSPVWEKYLKSGKTTFWSKLADWPTLRAAQLRVRAYSLLCFFYGWVSRPIDF